MSTHFIAIGGAGMSVVAELLLAQGEQVSGSDIQDSATLRRLERLGARVHVGHAGEHLRDADRVVVSTAIREDNVELIAARCRGLPVLHRSQALARAATDRTFVAVAGAHGKTTTSAMVAIGLRSAGTDPSFAIGAPVLALGTGAHLGSGPAFVAEADESDGSFLNYTPQIAVVTNIEPDHLDHYGTPEAFEAAFAAFARQVAGGGLLIACADDAGAARLARAAAAEGIRVQTYGAAPEADVRIESVRLTGRAAGGRLISTLGAVQLDVAVPGEHNLRNATAAWCVGIELGVDPAQMARALAEFTGTARRFEDRGMAGGVRVIDDYAHNPAKVAAALGAARRRAGAGRLIALFQPHLYSRTQAFAEQFARALQAADDVILAPIFPAREDAIPGVSSALIAERMDQAHVAHDLAAAADLAAGLAEPGDLVLTIGAGDVTTAAPAILDRLGRR
ncbi:MAG TPA: UDP-N-acetylmuramate--L-alanine ligase [Beutenbergiaceae bacterium]|nr:UDP-N-acetylmuramate--L-alanine ligase [Beutenbergiaceae bacterium]